MNQQIKSAGESLKMIGYLMLANILISGLFQYLIRESVRNFETENIETYFLYQSSLFILLLFIKSLLFISSGNDLINAFNQPVSNGIISENSVLEEELIINKVFYSNGNLKVIESYNKANKKHGVWEHYLEDGTLDFKELYENGNWACIIRN